MARLEERWPPGILAHLIGGTWCLLCVAGQVGQPEGLQPSWTPAPPLFSASLCWSRSVALGSALFFPLYCKVLSGGSAFWEAWDRWLRIEANAGWRLVPGRQGQTLGRTSWDPVPASRPRPGLSSSWAEKAVAELRSCNFPGCSRPASLLGCPSLSPFSFALLGEVQRMAHSFSLQLFQHSINIWHCHQSPFVSREGCIRCEKCKTGGLPRWARGGCVEQGCMVAGQLSLATPTPNLHTAFAWPGRKWKFSGYLEGSCEY